MMMQRCAYTINGVVRSQVGLPRTTSSVRTAAVVASWTSQSTGRKLIQRCFWDILFANTPVYSRPSSRSTMQRVDMVCVVMFIVDGFLQIILGGNHGSCLWERLALGCMPRPTHSVKMLPPPVKV